MTLNLKTEIENLNKGCGKRFEISENRLAICGKYYYDEKEQTLCPTCQAEISALKKGISACEEILNSQQTKPLEFVETDGGCKPTSLTDITRCNPSKDKTADTQTIEHYKKYGIAEGDKLLLETAKNNFKKGQESMKKEILEIIDKLKIKHTKEHRGCGDPSECCFNRLDVLGWDFFEDLKEQLTTEGEGKNEKI